MDYRVELESFHGPLDLLLYLVKKNEVEILDIPIATIAEQFQDYLRVLHVADVELAGDFLVMAATLLEIKSQMLLPRDAAEPATRASDPRRELVQQLIEYKKFKEAAARLDERAGESAQRLSRPPAADCEPPNDESDPLHSPLPTPHSLELWDLVSAFGRILAETQALESTRTIADDTPQSVYIEQVRSALARQRRVRLRDLFTPPFVKARLVGLFLAILELIRTHDALLDQEGLFGEIWLRGA